jgi:hypothetical protein
VLAALEMYFETAKTVLHPPVRFVLGKILTQKLVSQPSSQSGGS